MRSTRPSFIAYKDADSHLGVCVMDVAARFTGRAHRAIDFPLLKFMPAIEAVSRLAMPMHDRRMIALNCCSVIAGVRPSAQRSSFPALAVRAIPRFKESAHPLLHSDAA